MERRRLLPEEFLNYVTKQISSEQMRIWVKVNNINNEKIELFFDFISSLFYLIEETYLGDDVIINEEEKEGHFSWCWNKVITNFKEENIQFKNKGEHYSYFFNFFYESFYKNEAEVKTESELDMLVEMYQILENNLTVHK